ncbi:methyltransferase type 11 [Mycena galericulata]|nr:methyltransferase type 11 [Mycena galericulata]
MGNVSSAKRTHRRKGSSPKFPGKATRSTHPPPQKAPSQLYSTFTPDKKPALRKSLTIAYAPGHDDISEDAAASYNHFLQTFPEYRLTWTLDTLRRSDYGRLTSASETYLDYLNGAIYPESLIRAHGEFLSRHVLGDTHSMGTSSKMSTNCADEARAAVLSFFSASAEEYTVIFTSNATGALKLVGESYPFTGDSNYILLCDSHTSVHGIREFAARNGAHTHYIPSTPTGGFDDTTARKIMSRHCSDTTPNLFVMTAQSNISNTKNPLSAIEYAASLGYDTVLDAAAWAPASNISLTDCPVDAMAVSFYKMFGYPTGVGALIAKKSFLRRLKRPWLAGGAVEVFQVPATSYTRAHELHEQFEDGTINYLSLQAVTDGLRFLSAYMPFLPLRLSCLMHYLVSSLSQLRHDTTDTPVVRIVSAVPSRRLKFVGEQSDIGSLVSLVFLSPLREVLPNSFIEHATSRMHISLRIGAMCNPGGAAALLGITGDTNQPQMLGSEFGVVRISLGLASNFQDVWHFVRFSALIAQEKTRMALWNGWVAGSAHGPGAIHAS